MKNALVILILIVILGIALGYIIKSRKKGSKCIGCPLGGNCPYKHNQD